MNPSPLFWILGLLAVPVIVLLLSGARAKARLRRQYPPIGQLVDIDGYRLHMHVEGKGSLTVVLDSGAGGIGLGWELVRPAIAKVTRVVAYDRAGLGWSDPSPRPRDAVTMAEELHALMHHGNIPGPYILVGHSLGGPIARQFAARYPNEVAGLVMVDSAHEQQVKRFPERLVKTMQSMMGMFSVMRLLSRIGVFSLNPKMVPLGDRGRLPARVADTARAVIASSDNHLKATIAETKNVNAAQTQPVKTLGDLPLTVISHGQLDAVPPGIGPEIRGEYERTWQELQVEITSLSSRGRRLVAERSGHNILFDQPEMIIQSVLEMVDSLSGQGGNIPREHLTAG